MKTKEELNALKNEVKALNKKLAELNEDELKMVNGGSYDSDLQNYLKGLLNPPAAYTHAFDTNKPSPLPSDK